MLISELIDELEERKKVVGDVEVKTPYYVCGDTMYKDITEVNVIVPIKKKVVEVI